MQLVKTKNGQTLFKFSNARDWGTLLRELQEQKTLAQFEQWTFAYLMDTNITNHNCSI